MITIISGSRRITDYTIIEAAVKASGFTITMVVEGGQRTWDRVLKRPIGGVDYLAMLWARQNKIQHRRIGAKWAEHGKAAGPIRNREMAKLAKQLIAIPDSESTGTTDMIEAAQEAGLEIYVHPVS